MAGEWTRDRERAVGAFLLGHASAALIGLDMEFKQADVTTGTSAVLNGANAVAGTWRLTIERVDDGK